jgi:hypothetical protein
MKITTLLRRFLEFNSVKLDGRKFYVKIQILPCLGHITRLNCIKLFFFFSFFFNSIGVWEKFLLDFVSFINFGVV